MKNYLNFENDIKNLENEIDRLKDPYNQDGLSEVDTQKIDQNQNFLLITCLRNLSLYLVIDIMEKINQ